MRARDIMTSPVITVVPGTTIKKAAALLAERGFTALPVVDDDERLVGIVTEADLMRDRVPQDPRALIHPGHRPRTGAVTTTVGEVMTAPAAAMAPGTDLATLAAALLDANRRAMPIVEGARLVGIVTRRDIIRTVAREDAVIVADIRRRLAVYGGENRWDVHVHEGIVTIGDQFDDPGDRHVAKILAEAVPGVVRAHVVVAPDQYNR